MNQPEIRLPRTAPRDGHRPQTLTAPSRKPRAKNKKQRSEALALAQRLLFLRDEFPGAAFGDILLNAIVAVRRMAESTRESDRDGVLRAICEQGCRTMEEICEDTLLTRRVVQPILDELVGHDLVFITEKYTHAGDQTEGGRPELEYHPRHTLP